MGCQAVLTKSFTRCQVRFFLNPFGLIVFIIQVKPVKIVVVPLKLFQILCIYSAPRKHYQIHVALTTITTLNGEKPTQPHNFLRHDTPWSFVCRPKKCDMAANVLKGYTAIFNATTFCFALTKLHILGQFYYCEWYN